MRDGVYWPRFHYKTNGPLSDYVVFINSFVFKRRRRKKLFAVTRAALVKSPHLDLRYNVTNALAPDINIVCRKKKKRKKII